MELHYKDPKKRNLQRLELLIASVVLPLGLVWGGQAFFEWSAFRQAEQHFLEGQRQLAKGELQPALENLEKCLGIYPKYHGAWTALGVSHHMLGDHVKELETFRRAVDVIPNNGEFHRDLATAYHETGNHQKELEHLTIAQQHLGANEFFTARLLDRARREVEGTEVAKGDPVSLDKGKGEDHSHGHDHSGHSH